MKSNLVTICRPPPEAAKQGRVSLLFFSFFLRRLMRRSRFSGSKRRLAAKDDDGWAVLEQRKEFEVKGNRGAADWRRRFREELREKTGERKRKLDWSSWGGSLAKGKKNFGLRRDLSGMNTQYFFSFFFLTFYFVCIPYCFRLISVA